MSKPHSFHIPVMGTSYSIDTPIRVAHYGIDSVISIIDHRLTEKMRMHYSKKHGKHFELIPDTDVDCRAKRITAYLDLVHDIVQENFATLKKSAFKPDTEITKYFEMLPEGSPLKEQYTHMKTAQGEKEHLELDLKSNMSVGSIDVNIMTKIDGKTQNKSREDLPVEFNEAHAALRGFINSKINSSLVLSAGLNPRLFGYMSTFKAFLPHSNGSFSKRIILKVSDYRSALVQGKMLAKKGLWVSEYRIESGLNCGGHAFATEGNLLGPIMQEFKEKRHDLRTELFELYTKAIQSLHGAHVHVVPEIDITVQGGVGNAAEHNLLLSEFGMNSVGWGSPFLLVPEAVNIDKDTLDLLQNAKEEDYYLSDVSPLGVRFNTVKNTTAEQERDKRVEKGKAGSPCYKKHLAFNTEFTKEPICTASNKYQKRKIKQLEESISDSTKLTEAVKKVTEKLCLCVGLANGSLINDGLKMYKGMPGVAVCPGPNMAYFSNVVSLKEMVDHIYGRTNIIKVSDRPNMFLKELNMYLNYFQEKLDEQKMEITEKQVKYLESFRANLNMGIDYYRSLLDDLAVKISKTETNILEDLNLLQKRLNSASVSMG